MTNVRLQEDDLYSISCSLVAYDFTAAEPKFPEVLVFYFNFSDFLKFGWDAKQIHIIVYSDWSRLEDRGLIEYYKKLVLFLTDFELKLLFIYFTFWYFKHIFGDSLHQVVQMQLILMNKKKLISI